MPVRISRTVRCIINPSDGPDSERGVNGFAGKPAMRGLGRYYELTLVAEGKPDATTGYLINIKAMDQAVREGALPTLERACRDTPAMDPASLLAPMLSGAIAALGGPAHTLTLSLTPTYRLTMLDTDRDHVLIRQQFDFAAAHRLHAPSLSDEANRDTFGRCNNPSGHGHNYRVEPAVWVRTPGEDEGETRFPLDALEAVVHETIIDPFDHTHLDVDRPEFAGGARTSSVENIARVFYERLRPAIDRASGGTGELAWVTVWETDRTSSTYPAQSIAAGV
ncbi:MAG: 6-carboxytetrahydropterin synthase [Planctomycetota bacterium]